MPKSGTQFPIESTADGFKGRRKSFLNGVNDTHVAAIERLQPYNGCKWTKALVNISNPDKHRHFTVVKGAATGIFYTREDIGFDEIALPIIRTPHPLHGEMDVKFGFSLAITLADGTAVIETLQEIKAEVANTLVLFKAEF